jgi:hypothetical protein
VKIIKTEIGTTNHKLQDQSLQITNAITDNHVITANTFNKCFILVADSITRRVRSDNDHENSNNPTKY